MLSKTEKPSKEQTEYRANKIELNEKIPDKIDRQRRGCRFKWNLWNDLETNLFLDWIRSEFVLFCSYFHYIYMHHMINNERCKINLNHCYLNNCVDHCFYFSVTVTKKEKDWHCLLWHKIILTCTRVNSHIYMYLWLFDRKEEIKNTKKNDFFFNFEY